MSTRPSPSLSGEEQLQHCTGQLPKAEVHRNTHLVHEPHNPPLGHSNYTKLFISLGTSPLPALPC